MSVWLIPQQALSEEAARYRQLWVDRWGALDPPHLYDAPEGVLYTHLHAHPEFRSPLSPADEGRVSAEFHREALWRLARGRPVTVLTFEYEAGVEYEQVGPEIVEISDQDRDPWVSYIEDPDDEDRVVVHVFRTDMAADDARLFALVDRAAEGNVGITFTCHDLTWVARPYEECMALYSFEREDLAILEGVESEVWARWGIHQGREPLLDLGQVAAEFERRLPIWKQAGVTVNTGPQYRSWDGDRIEILDDLPSDLTSVDWFLVGLEANAADATVIVFDTGTCQVMIAPDSEDPDADMIFEYRQHPGSHDLAAVMATLDRVVAALTGPSLP